MKREEIAARAAKGEILTVVEYRGTKLEAIEYKDKQTREAKTFEKLAHTVETPTESFKVEEDTRKIKDFSPSKYVAPFKKGQMVVFIVESFQRIRDAVTARGHLEPLEN